MFVYVPSEEMGKLIPNAFAKPQGASIAVSTSHVEDGDPVLCVLTTCLAASARSLADAYCLPHEFCGLGMELANLDAQIVLQQLSSSY